MSRNTFRWGILGTGRIAGDFAEGLTSVSGATLQAVGSRTAAKSREFGQRFGATTCHGSYEALARDPDVDAIYVSTPHSLHMENTLLCLDAGKPVLCEKPFAINARQAAQMIERAHRKKLFLMEAMWSRFIPLTRHIHRLVLDGALGDVRMIKADFGFRADFNPEGRLFDPALGGGALLDIGIYPISMANKFFGEPIEIASQASLGTSGVDEVSAFVLKHSGGKLSVLSSAVRLQTPMEASILGTEGWIRINRPFWKPVSATLHRSDGLEESIDMPHEGNGYNYEAMAVMECLREGRMECPLMPLEETLSIMKTLDRIRKQWNLRYPMES